MEHKLYLPSKLLLHNAKMMAKINRLNSGIFPPFDTVAHLRPHIPKLKATFVFLGSVSPRLLYDITTGGPRAGASLPCVGSDAAVIHFPRYLFIITQSNKCAMCRVTPPHTSGTVTRVSVSSTHQGYPRSRSPADTRNIIHLFVIWKYSLTK